MRYKITYEGTYMVWIENDREHVWMLHGTTKPHGREFVRMLHRN